MPFANITKKKILNSKKLLLKYKNQIGAQDKKVFEKEFKRTFNNVHLYSISNAAITKNGMPLIINFNLIKDYLKFDSISNFVLFKKIILLFDFIFNFSKLFNKKNFLFIKNAVYLHDRHSSNYYHWITDVLPKIMLAKEKNIFDENFLLLPKFNTNFQKESALLITKKIKIINSNLFVENLKYISDLHTSGFPRIEFLLKFKKKCLSIILNNKKNNKKKIFISRKYSSRRKILNENNIVKILKKKKFHICYPEKLSFLEQIKLFSNCNTLISNHGAGLTNLIWMKKSSEVIEIREPKININPFFVLSSMLKIKYNYYFVNNKSFLSFLSHRNYNLDLNGFFKKFRNI